MRSLLPSGVRAAAAIAACGAVLLSAPVARAALFRATVADASLEASYPDGSRFYTLSVADARDALAAAPMESFDAPVPGVTIALPMPHGASAEFEVWEAPVMHPDLQARYPEIRTYRGRGIDDPYAALRLDVTPAGLHAMILSADPTVFIDPVAMGDPVHVTHFKRSVAQAPELRSFRCDFQADPQAEREIDRLVQARSGLRTGEQLRTYRTCVACTGEYAATSGGTVPGALAAIVTSVNRVTGVYEREVSCRLELIANNDDVIFLDGATDPYTNNNGSTMLGQNQTTLTSLIGSANYDLGHVFSTGGGGIAQLGVVCNNGAKARGVTGLNNPHGDSFDIDFVAHEMGHQFGATHTFNGNAGNCGGGNRTASTAYEPGSGSTIMAYAGICSDQNIALHSHDNFHLASYLQITAFTQSGGGSGCPVVTNTGNLPPAVVAGNAGHTIPISTPFILYGSVADPDNDPVTWNWEEYDLGPAGAPSAPSGNAPIMRAWSPSTNDWRSFPRRADVRNGTSVAGELLPTYTRTFAVRLSGRDGLGGVAWDATTLNVDGTSGPFRVTSIDATPWQAGEMRTITWDVANTDVAPVDCDFVDILLSTNDGRDVAAVLAANTPNDGSEAVLVPGLPTIEARVEIDAVGNVFYAMNDDGFVLEDTITGAEQVAALADDLALRVRPNPFAGRTSVSFATKDEGMVDVAVYDATGRRVATLLHAVRDAGSHTVEWNGRDASAERVASGVYFLRVTSAEGVRNARVVRLQ